MDHVIPADLKAEFDDSARDGFRVLALAYRDLEPKPAYSKDDETRSDLARLCGLPRPAQGHRPVGHRRTPSATASRSRCSRATTSW